MFRIAFFLATLLASGAAEAACSGQFAKLSRLAGEQPDRLLAHPAVSQRMTKLMGPELAHLKASLSVAGPIALIDCELVVEGNAPHQGGEHNAILSFNLYSGIVTVAMLDNRRILVRSTPHRYRDPNNYSHLPTQVRDWIYVAANAFRSRGDPPANVTILTPPSP